MNKLLLLAGKGLSGINEPIISELQKKWSIIANVDPFYYSFYKKIENALFSFSRNKSLWKIKYHEERAFQQRTPKAFLNRSNICQNSIEKLTEEYDIIFQLMSTFSPLHNNTNKPYVIYVDRTQKVAEKYFPILFNRMSENEKKELHTLVSNAFQMATKIFTFNDETRKSVINDYGISSEKVFSVGFGVNLNPYPEVLKTKSKKIVSVISDFERHSGRLCIETIKLVQQQDPKIEFILIGQVDSNIQNELKGKVQVIPNIPHNKLLDYYSESMILLAPAIIGSSQSITEAMAFKCLCIANSENPDARNIISNGLNGVLVDDNTADAFSKKILELINSPDCISIGDSAHLHVKNNHTWRKVIEKMNIEIEKIKVPCSIKPE